MIIASDNADRVRVLKQLEATLLVEAAAGTGKTSLLAGRVAALMASGVAPRHIAAITFTDFAAGELRARIARFIGELLNGVVPRELEAGFPHGLSMQEQAFLQQNALHLDELSSTTIHSFCHALLRSYAVEADIDPGANVLSKVQTDLAFRSVFEHWLNRRLGKSAKPDDAVAFMAQWDPKEAVETLHKLGTFRREFSTARPVPANLEVQANSDFVQAVIEFRRWFDATPRPEKAAADLLDLEQLVEFYGCAFDPLPPFGRLWQLAHPPQVKCMRWRTFDLRPYHRLQVWQKAAGYEAGTRLHAEATYHYGRCADTFRTLLGQIATTLVASYCSETDELLAEFAAYKRNVAALDFDDLLLCTRRLLNAREEVRRAISKRYTHLLIDEFQDTDPVQAEILFLIASSESATGPWQHRRLVPGALFMVGDPKQSIYRFRGADVAAYLDARAAIERQFPGNILRITSNFRSREQILAHVNRCFSEGLGRQASGYVPLEPTLGPPEHGLPCVARVVVDVEADRKLEVKREAEAKCVAELCARLIGNVRVRRSDGHVGRLVPGDIALLTPGRTDVWRYEHELEEKRLPFVSQAGRNLFRRQETQDLVAIIRTLANPRDTLALGSFLRGPLVGLTEQELLDVVKSLPGGEGDSELAPGLTLNTPPEFVGHAVAREVLTILHELRMRARSTTPFLIISEAIERLKVRATLAARSADQASRALANLEVLMERARAYSVLGLTRLAHDLETDWDTAAGYDEARMDSSGQSINIVTMHSSKGLEWPVVIPINMGSEFRRRDPFIYRRRDDTLHWVLGDVVPPAMADAVDQEDREATEERERLLYVACTRAIDLLILPQFSATSSNSWAQLLDLKYGDLPELTLTQFTRQRPLRVSEPDNLQTAEIFRDQQSQIRTAASQVRWVRPSEADTDLQPLAWSIHEELEQIDVKLAQASGSSTRGLVLHKLMEELLTGEVMEAPAAVEARAAVLLHQLDRSESADPSEIATTALRCLALPAIKDRRSRLVPEISIYASLEEGLLLVAGRADAIAYENGVPEAVFDWKSDVAPSDANRLSYKSQVWTYAKAVGAPRGAIVYMSLGQVHWVETA